MDSVFISLGPISGIVEFYGYLYLVDTAELFSKVIVSFSTSTARLERSDGSFFLPLFGAVSLLKFQPFQWVCIVISCNFNLNPPHK